MAWGARSGLKQFNWRLPMGCEWWLNGLGSPFGIETGDDRPCLHWTAGLNGLGSPFGIETGDRAFRFDDV